MDMGVSTFSAHFHFWVYMYFNMGKITHTAKHQGNRQAHTTKSQLDYIY